MRTMFAIACLLTAGSATAHPETASQGQQAAVAAVAPAARPAAAVIDAFHAALRRGDTRAALAKLADNALIYEQGGVERGKQEYASHHLGADAEFAKAVPSTITRRAGEAIGNVAWIATEGRTTGTFNGKAIDRVTTETMVLRRQQGTWKITHIHWSSAAGGR